MGIVIGENSYCAVKEADEYISGRYVASSEEYMTWMSLSNADKEVYMIRSTDALNTLRYIGRKVRSKQTLSFPRTQYNGFGVILVPTAYNTVGDVGLIRNSETDSDGGLTSAKYAQIENALIIPIADKSNIKDDVRENLIRGLTSKKIGSVSETYTAYKKNSQADNLMKDIYATSKIEGLLKCWLSSSILSR